MAQPWRRVALSALAATFVPPLAPANQPNYDTMQFCAFVSPVAAAGTRVSNAGVMAFRKIVRAAASIPMVSRGSRTTPQPVTVDVGMPGEAGVFANGGESPMKTPENPKTQRRPAPVFRCRRGDDRGCQTRHDRNRERPAGEASRHQARNEHVVSHAQSDRCRPPRCRPREAGPSDGPAVILLHGWPYDIHSYADVAPLLATAGYRVIVLYVR
ncbi:MAG TPA: hypothetical protein VGG57_21285 [Stellaceae bacterium]|jgi:hypothetical protein